MNTAPMASVRRAPSRMEEKRRLRDSRRTIFLGSAAGVIGVISLGMAVGNSFSVPTPQGTFHLPPTVDQPTEPRWHPPQRTLDTGPPVTPPVQPSSLPGLPSVAAHTRTAPASPPRATQRPQSASTTGSTTTSSPATTTPTPLPTPQPTETTETTATEAPDPCLLDPLLCPTIAPTTTVEVTVTPEETTSVEP